MDRAEKIEAIAEYYGLDSQSRQTTEECGELITALNKYYRAVSGKATRKKLKNIRMDIAQEIADVQVMLWQISILYDIAEQVSEKIDYKLDRQLERISEEKAI